MSNDPDALLDSIDNAMLSPLVQRVPDNEVIEVTDWKCQRLRPSGGGATEGVFRLGGDASVNGEVIRWSLILKVIQPRPDRDDPSGWAYWKRELLAYQSGLLADLPGGLAVPRCLGVVRQPEGRHWLWLEEVSDAFDHRWPFEHHNVAAHPFGCFNGAYLGGRPMPPYPWVTRGDVHQSFGKTAPAMERLRSPLDHPLLSRNNPPDVAQGILRLWDQREVMAETMDRLPKVLCHGGAGKVNLFARRKTGGGYETVAIDWAYMRIGEIGEDMIGLALGPLYRRQFDMDQGIKLESMVFEGYLKGLREAGWKGDRQMLRLGYLVGAALFLGLVVTRMETEVLLDESRLLGQRSTWDTLLRSRRIGERSSYDYC
jgi:hypothetical protein